MCAVSSCASCPASDEPWETSGVTVAVIAAAGVAVVVAVAVVCCGALELPAVPVPACTMTKLDVAVCGACIEF